MGVAIGVATIAGHVKPVFLMGKGGGKGVATGSGVFMALAPTATLVALGAFITVVAVSRYVSLGSLVGALSLPVILLWQADAALTPLVLVGFAIAAFVCWTHRENVKRLVRGEERRIGGASLSKGGT